MTSYPARESRARRARSPVACRLSPQLDPGATAEGRGGSLRRWRRKAVSECRTPPSPAYLPLLPALVLALLRLHAAAAGAEEESADAPAPASARAPPRLLPPLTPSRSVRRRRRLELERPAAASAGRGRWGWAEARRRRRRQRWAPALRGPSAAPAGRPPRRRRGGAG